LEKAKRKYFQPISESESDGVEEDEQDSESESNDVQMKEAEGEEQNKQDTTSEVLDNGEENAMERKPWELEHKPVNLMRWKLQNRPQRTR
jgi:hypothetical protein